MPTPDALPIRGAAHLAAHVRCILEHPVLKSGRQYVEEPDADAESTYAFRAAFDRDANTVTLLDFPAVTDAVETKRGRVAAHVTVHGEPKGEFNTDTGAITLPITLSFNPDALLARTSTVRLDLLTEARIDEAEMTVEGNTLTADDDRLVMVGLGTFDSGTLRGGTIWLAVECIVQQIDADD